MNRTEQNRTEQNRTEQSRIDYLDIFRALGIICMIMGHVGFGYLFDKWIHGFHMPMFFFISGWLYKHREGTIGNEIKRKAKSLLIPYLSIGFIELIFCYLTMDSYYGWSPLQQFLFSNTSGSTPVPGALWFLTAMFFSDLIYILLDKICSSKALNILIIAVSIFGMIQVWILRYRLPWAIDAGCVGAGFIHIGRLWRSSSLNKLMNLPLWKMVFLGAIVFASILICPYVNMRTATYGLFPMFWINALAAIIVGWNFSRYILRAFKKLKWDNISNWIQNIGRNSIVYLCLNQICIIVTAKIFNKLHITGMISRFLILGTVLLELLIAERLIINTPVCVIIGKKSKAHSVSHK